MKNLRLLFVFMLLGLVQYVMGQEQDIKITAFARNTISVNRGDVLDKTKTPCAMIRLSVRDEKVVVDANLGVKKKVITPGEIILYVPQGTKTLTVKCKHKHPLRNYKIPVKIVAKGVYDAVIEIDEKADSSKKAKKVQFYATLGCDVVNVIGPSVAFGTRIKHHNIEISGVLGLNKSDDFYQYQSLNAFYKYQVKRAQIKYGYGISLTDYSSIIPMVGVSFNHYHGTETDHPGRNRWDLKNAHSFSGIGALRLESFVSKHMKVHITPEYIFNVKQNVDCAVLTWRDKTVLRWNTGFNLNLGLAVVF